MSVDGSLLLITTAAAPGIGLVAIGFAGLYWGKSIRALPATLFSLGVALLALMTLTLLVYSTPLVDTLEEIIMVVLGVTPFIYAASLIACMRHAKLSVTGVAVFGTLGLVPLWHLSGFVLMNSACSFGTGGC